MVERSGHTAVSKWNRAAGLAISRTAVIAVFALVVCLGVFGATGTATAATTHYTYTTSEVITYTAGLAGPLISPTVTIPDPINNILYVLDSGNNRIVKYNLTTRVYLGSITGGAVPFNNPRGMALQPGIGDAARLFVSDTGNNRLVVLLPSGTVRATFTDTKGRTPILSPKQMVWSEAAQRLYVLNVLPGETASQVLIYRSNTNNGTPPSSQLMLTGTFAGSVATNSTLSASANGINVLLDNSIVVADTGNSRVLRFGADGTYVNQFVAPSGLPVSLSGPKGITRRADGYVPVVDTNNHRIQVFLNFEGGEVVAEFGEAGVAGSDDTHLNSPEYNTALSNTVTLISDTGNNRLILANITVTEDAPDRIPTNFDGVACTDCHNQDTHVEHQYRAQTDCLSCHEYSLRTGKTDYTLFKPKWTSELAAAGKTGLGTCGENTTFCHSAEAKSDMGKNIATHGMDGAQIQDAHMPRNVDGTPAPTNACSGEKTGGCHSEGSEESVFWFGAQDPASAKLDYWYQQMNDRATVVEGSLTGTGTVDIRKIDPPCLVCHAKTGVGVAFGETQKRAAEANGEAWTCTTTDCHDKTGASGVYSESQCFRTPDYSTNHRRVAGDGGGAMSPMSMPEEEPTGISAMFTSLIDMVSGGSEPEPADVTILADPETLPESATPATQPTSLDLLLCPTY